MLNITIKHQVYKGIPYNEYYSDIKDSKGLVFIQHGFESNKNRGADYIGVDLARLGFNVVAIDAYKHGSRIEEPFISKENYEKFEDAFNVIDKSGDDILEIYNGLYESRFESFDFIGVSMGGMIAYNCALKTNRINRLIPVISTPYLYQLAEWLVDREDNDFYREKLVNIKDYIVSIDPYYKMEELKYHELYMINTLRDDIVPFKFSDHLYGQNLENVSFQVFDEKHVVSREMKEHILSYIAKEKVVL